MTISLRVVALLVILRLLLFDIEFAHDWWGWATVGFDVLIAGLIFGDREDQSAGKDSAHDRD
ncbi:hypothetical protein [Amycolatopsis anabasis]|uniref:hypothetical protein n=1 Tax=Amycolatopsis anabasis TaxID=1840409 RepID=UPI00131AE054|nr:hypothetical protein [Amycolatopsis anabasis]